MTGDFAVALKASALMLQMQTGLIQLLAKVILVEEAVEEAVEEIAAAPAPKAKGKSAK
jgi:hypothetical protein